VRKVKSTSCVLDSKPYSENQLKLSPLLVLVMTYILPLGRLTL